MNWIEAAADFIDNHVVMAKNEAKEVAKISKGLTKDYKAFEKLKAKIDAQWNSIEYGKQKGLKKYKSAIKAVKMLAEVNEELDKLNDQLVPIVENFIDGNKSAYPEEHYWIDANTKVLDKAKELIPEAEKALSQATVLIKTATVEFNKDEAKRIAAQKKANAASKKLKQEAAKKAKAEEKVRAAEEKKRKVTEKSKAQNDLDNGPGEDDVPSAAATIKKEADKAMGQPHAGHDDEEDTTTTKAERQAESSNPSSPDESPDDAEETNEHDEDDDDDEDEDEDDDGNESAA